MSAFWKIGYLFQSSQSGFTVPIIFQSVFQRSKNTNCVPWACNHWSCLSTRGPSQPRFAVNLTKVPRMTWLSVLDGPGEDLRRVPRLLMKAEQEPKTEIFSSDPHRRASQQVLHKWTGPSQDLLCDSSWRTCLIGPRECAIPSRSLHRQHSSPKVVRGAGTESGALQNLLWNGG